MIPLVMAAMIITGGEMFAYGFAQGDLVNAPFSREEIANTSARPRGFVFVGDGAMLEKKRMKEIEAPEVYTATEREIRETCRVSARKYDLDEQLFLRQLAQESALNPLAENGNCKGLGQINLDFYPLSNRVYWPSGDWRDPEANADLAAMIMRDYLRKYHGNYLRALTAYCWGPKRLDDLLEAHSYDWLLWLPSDAVYYLDRIIGGEVEND